VRDDGGLDESSNDPGGQNSLIRFGIYFKGRTDGMYGRIE
jgi:hypothetical protein